MDNVQYLKFRQHGDLRTLLLNTYPSELVYVDSADPFWGDGAGLGRNELGQSLMRVRERLRADILGIQENVTTSILHPPSQTIPVAIAPSSSSGPMPMLVPMTGGGTLPTPTPSLGAGAVPQIIKFNGYGEFSGLLYHSPHSVVFQEELYPTALHLFEACRFIDHRSDLADRVRQCSRVEDVPAISAEMAVFTRRDWDNVALVIVRTFLSLRVSRLFFFKANRLNCHCGFRWTMFCASSFANM